MNIPFERGKLIGQTGIRATDTMFILDSSKIQQLMDCPRGFFFSHILGWQSERTSIHLVFGSAWHEAMEHLLLNGSSKASIMEAHDKFMEVYTEEYGSDPFLDEHYSKNPGNALKALAEYVSTYKVDPDQTIYTEIAGAAPIRQDRAIQFKMDAILRHPPHHEEAGKYFSLEHKTTSRKTKSWQEKWSYKFQVGTYLHALHCWVEDLELIDGITINGSIFRKNDVEHLRIPIRKTQQQMLEYLYEANYWWDFYEEQCRKLAQVTPSDKVMVAFPRNTESCSKFGCKFPGLCNSRPNPCRDLTTPNGYKVDYWDPRRKREEAKHVMDLDKEDSKTPKTNE